MRRSLLPLVLLVSCAHALVHVYELSVPSVEQLIASEFHVDKPEMGVLGSCWRLPFGLGAVLVGWLVDRLGAKWMLVTYLAGCAASCILVWKAPELGYLFTFMFAMGSFASIYHPAGLSLISHTVEPHERPKALSYHGIFGSLGISGSPFLAALLLNFLTWRQFYVALAVPGIVLAIVLAMRLPRPSAGQHPSQQSAAELPSVARLLNRSFVILCLSGMLGGFVYAGLMNFLPRYLSDLGIRPDWIEDKIFRNLVTGGALAVGVIGQYAAGRIGKPGQLERQQTAMLVAIVPLLVAMAFAEGAWRIVAACAVMLVQFMQQPIYNSLIPQFVSVRRRSLAYGISNMLGFGFGSVGARFAGQFSDDRIVYTGLAAASLLSAILASLLIRDSRRGDASLATTDSAIAGTPAP